eukprot:CAMPEP_0173168586 /NCGR_PEP_ID=MMETSP1141-20130122/234_1 /TAXON_ID=483371 /ORGANISM="non described non described, Strain CCMP2298" /LENGTH=44 /DNA_ID= /DNA_START= /DNA_END= /DNA_ORIENTATION=
MAQVWARQAGQGFVRYIAVVEAEDVQVGAVANVGEGGQSGWCSG